MADDPDSPLVPPQPGVNGVRYAARTGHLYYTSTARKLFMRVPVDPGTHDPAGAPEFVAGGTMADDFCLDEDDGVAYLTAHRQNTIDRVPLQHGGSAARQVVAGDPFDEQLVGPSGAAWGRYPGDYGRIAYVTTDGGLVAPPTDDIVRPAKLLRVELPVGRLTC
jgi:sugar lactone lactonase YvrE